MVLQTSVIQAYMFKLRYILFQPCARQLLSQSPTLRPLRQLRLNPSAHFLRPSLPAAPPFSGSGTCLRSPAVSTASAPCRPPRPPPSSRCCSVRAWLVFPADKVARRSKEATQACT